MPGSDSSCHEADAKVNEQYKALIKVMGERIKHLEGVVAFLRAQLALPTRER